MKHLFTTLTIALAANISANAQNCMGDWQYAIPIEINNSCSDTLTDYQVILSVATDSLITNGKLQANGEDLRFTMGGCCNALCYNIESGINTNSTLVVVKIPQLLPWDTVTLNMHYGNNAAVAADDPDCTYDFWDDFNDSNFDLTKWETRGNPTVTEGGGTLTLISNSNWGYCRSLVNFSGRTLIRESRRVGAGTSNANVVGFTGTDNRYGFYISGGLATLWDNDVTGGASVYNSTYPQVPAPGNSFVDYSIDMEINQSNQMRIHEYCNTTLSNCNSNVTDFNQFTGTSFYVGYTSWNSSHFPVVDWIYVTKSNDTIPTYSFQSEVTVTPGPISLGNDTAFCQGDSLTLSPNGNWQTYTWNTNDTTSSITVSSTGNYSVTVTNEIGCDIVDTVDITVNPLPDATFTSSNTGTTYDFTNTEAGGSTWEWDFGDGDTSSAQNPTHTYGSEGTFVVCLTVTDTNGCQSTHCDSIDAQFPSGINNTTKVVSMQAYPNPANENLNLMVELNNNSRVVIELTALDGRVVKQLHTGQLQSGTNNLQLNFSGVANGSYILQLQQQNGETINTIINKQ